VNPDRKVAVAVAALVLGVAGCGGGGESTSSSTTPESTTAQAPVSTHYLEATLSASTAGEPGVVVQSVDPGSTSHLRVGDVIVAVNGTPVATPDELIKIAGEPNAGGHFTIRIVRGTRRFTLTEYESPTAYIGAEVKDAPHGDEGAVVVSVTPGSPAAKAGIEPGDVITAIDATAVASVDDLLDVIATHGPGEKVTVTLKRGSRRLELTATLAERPTP
jgi:S1-C subfamily serine protease